MSDISTRRKHFNFGRARSPPDTANKGAANKKAGNKGGSNKECGQNDRGQTRCLAPVTPCGLGKAGHMQSAMTRSSRWRVASQVAIEGQLPFLESLGTGEIEQRDLQRRGVLQ